MPGEQRHLVPGTAPGPGQARTPLWVFLPSPAASVAGSLLGGTACAPRTEDSHGPSPKALWGEGGGGQPNAVAARTETTRRYERHFQQERPPASPLPSPCSYQESPLSPLSLHCQPQARATQEVSQHHLPDRCVVQEAALGVGRGDRVRGAGGTELR